MMMPFFRTTLFSLLAVTLAFNSSSWANISDECPADSVAQWRSQPAQGVINTANIQADAGNTLQAICRYQVVLEKIPNDTTLKNNLSVLMFNHAMSLSDAKQFAQTRQWLEQAQQLQPGSNQPQKALAVTYFNEAQWLRRNDTTPDWPTYRQLIQRARQLDPEQPAYTDGLAHLLASEGAALANRGQLDEAELRLNESLALLPTSSPTRTTVTQSLANVTIQQAKKHPTGSPQQKQLLAQAQALDTSDEMKQLIKQVKRGEAATIKAAHSVDTANVYHAPNLSMQEKLAAMRQALGQPAESTETLPDQIAAIEKQLYGDDQKAPLNQRVDSAYQSLLGAGQTLEHSAPNLTITPSVQTTEGTYLANILNTTDGRIIRWGRFPINVYLDGPKDAADWQSPLPPPAVMEALRAGVERWVWATKEYVSVVWVSNPNEADVVFHLVNDTYTDRFADPDVAVLPDYTLPKASKLAKALGLASMFVPGYYGMAPRVAAAGLQYKEAQKIDRVRKESDIELGWDVLTHPVQVANIAAYEFGHALGLKGASPNKADLMHPETILATEEKPVSETDVATLMALYERPASIILNLQ